MLIAIFSFTQLVDNFLYQPVIYSTSIKSKPLEIFIVLLVVGHLGGPLSMIVAIPCYTVVRVIAFRFFSDIKAIKRLENK
jgi:predicted PurR-regulated permease PerM